MRKSKAHCSKCSSDKKEKALWVKELQWCEQKETLVYMWVCLNCQSTRPVREMSKKRREEHEKRVALMRVMLAELDEVE